MDRKAYWGRTVLHTVGAAATGASLGAVVGIVGAAVFLSKGHPVSGGLAFLAGPLLAGFLIAAVTAGGCLLGAIIGFLWPVSGGPAYAAQFLPKAGLLCLAAGTAYGGFLRPLKTRQRLDQSLKQALWMSNLGDVKKAVEAGAPVDSWIGDGSALTLAAQRGDVELCRYLLSKGAQIDFRNHQGETPLITALKFSKWEAALLLLASGADPNVADGHGETPLIVATARADERVLRELIGKGAQVNVAINYGSYSPLMTAVMYKRPDTVKLLLDAGADPNLAPRGGRSPLSLARTSGTGELADLLLARGAK